MKKLLSLLSVIFSLTYINNAIYSAEMTCPDDMLLVEHNIHSSAQIIETDKAIPKSIGLPAELIFHMPDKNFQVLGTQGKKFELLHSSLRGWLVRNEKSDTVIDKHFIRNSLKMWRDITTQDLSRVVTKTSSDLCFYIRKNCDSFSMEDVSFRQRGGFLSLAVIVGVVIASVCSRRIGPPFRASHRSWKSHYKVRN